MSIFDTFKEMSASDIQKAFGVLDEGFDEYFGEHGQRRRFMEACNKLSFNDLHITQKVLKGNISCEELQRLTKDIESPSRVANTLLMLEEELEVTTDTVIFIFLLNLVQCKNVLTSLNRARFLFWEDPLLENKHLPSEFIEFLWESNKNKRYKDDEQIDLVRTISKHPNCPIKVLNGLYNVNDLSTRKAVSRHANIDNDLVNTFLKSKRMSDRLNIANSSYVCKEALLSLMIDEQKKVSDTAKKQFKKKFSSEKANKKEIEEAVLKRLGKPYVKPAKPKRKFDAFQDARMGLEHILQLSPSQRASIVKSGELWKEHVNIIEALCNDKSIAVRRAVSAHYLCPDKTLKHYLNDSDFVIVTNALSETIRREPSTVFENVVSQEVIDISCGLLNIYINEKSSIHPEDKLGIQAESEVKRIMLLARHTNNPLIQMRIINDLDGIPASRMRWHLLRELRYNINLIEAGVRKIAIELGFGSYELLKSYNNKELVIEYLAQDDLSNNDIRNFGSLLESFDTAP